MSLQIPREGELMLLLSKNRCLQVKITSETGHTETSVHECDWNSALIQSTLKSLEAQSEWLYVQASREGTKLFIISVKTCIAPNLLELYFCNLLKC